MAFADVTRLKAAEADATTAFERERRLRELLDVVTRAHAAVMLAEPSAALDREAGARHALQVMADEARALVGAELAAIGMGGSEEARFEPWVYSGIPEERARAIGDPPRAVGVLGVAAGRAAPLRLRDVRDHPAFRGFPEGHPPMKSFLSVPIRQEDRVLGTLYAANKRGGDAFTEDDERTLQILAARAAILLELVRLREVEARALAWQREVVTQMPEAVVLVGESQAGRISLNAAARALFGIDGRDAIEAVGPDGAPVPAEDLPHERASRGERICGLELRVRRPDGELVPVVASAAPVDDGRPASAVAVYRDVSLAKRLEQERDEWTGIVAHDLRQPTMVVSLSAQLLLRYTEGLGPKEAKSVSRIVEASHTLSRMIDDLLDVTLIDTQRLKLKLARVDVVALVREVVDRSRPMFGGRAVNVRAAEEAAVTAADTDRVSQVLTNFLSNAAKYSHPESDIEVRVSRADGAIEVAVENRGEGMKPEEASNVFQRFYRTQRAQAGTLGGLGLGLYICKGLIDAHGGAIGVRSVPGQTTTFWFRLPERSPPDAG
jgi:PAS domain S-box-containing protein